MPGMGNKTSHKVDMTSNRKRFKNITSFGSKSVDNFCDIRENEIFDENYVLQAKNVTKLEVKIFRSYTNLNYLESMGNVFSDKTSGIRIYKKSSSKFDYNTFKDNNEDKIIRQISRCNSLPKTFGKSKGVRNSVTYTVSNSNMTSVLDGQYSRISLLDKSSNLCQVAKEDFVSGGMLKERLNVFERKLVDAILKQLTSFSLPFQTSLIPLALFPPNDESSLRAHSLLTLKCYLENKSDCSFDLVASSGKSQCALFVPPSSLEGLSALNHNSDIKSISNFSRSLLLSMSQEAARDLGRMYEYQIGLLTSDFSIGVLASYIADRIVSYITHDMKVPLVERNSLLLGALNGRTNKKTLSPAIVSVILGKRELKWDIYEIIDKPGLRKSLMIYQDCEMLSDGPFQFFASPSSDYMTYGYRGQMLELDFSRGVYKPHKSEMSDFHDEVLWRYDDIHRDYAPHFHFIGDQFFKRFLLEQGPSGVHQDLICFTKKFLSGTAYHKEDITVILAPLGREDLPDTSICNFTEPSLVQRIPWNLLSRQFTRKICQTTPSPSADIPIFEDQLTPSKFESTSLTGQNIPNSFQAFIQKPVTLSDSPHAF